MLFPKVVCNLVLCHTPGHTPALTTSTHTERGKSNQNTKIIYEETE